VPVTDRSVSALSQEALALLINGIVSFPQRLTAALLSAGDLVVNLGGRAASSSMRATVWSSMPTIQAMWRFDKYFPAFFLRLGNGSEASGRGNIRDKAVCTSKSSIISDAVI